MLTVLPFRREMRTTWRVEKRGGESLSSKGKRGEKSPSAPSPLHILRILPPHGLCKAAQSFAQILTEPYSSASTREAAAWTETRPGGNRRTKTISDSWQQQKDLSLGCNNFTSWLGGGCEPSAAAPARCSSGRLLTDFSRAAALPLPWAPGVLLQLPAQRNHPFR